MWRIRALQSNVFPHVSLKLLGPVNHLHDQPGTSSSQNFGKAKVEVDIYVDYEVNKNDSIKDFINILKNKEFWKKHQYCFSAEDYIPGGLFGINLWK